MNRMKLAQECVEIDEAGGNVLDFLRMRGCISPWGTWYRLQIEELGRTKGQITEGRGGNEMSKITLEQKKKAVEMAIRGESPLPYLKKCGSTAPDKTWWYIKNKLKDADPELYAQIPDMRKAEPEKPVTCCAPSTRKGVEVPDEIPDAPKTLDGGGWEPYQAEPKVQLTVKAEDLKAVMDAPDEIQEEKPTAQLTAKVVPVKLEEVKDLLDAPVADAEEKPKPGIVSTLKYDRDGNLRMEVGRPLDQLGIKIYGLTAPAGDFQTAGGMLAWYQNGKIVANRRIEDWKKLLETLPIVMEIMNI